MRDGDGNPLRAADVEGEDSVAERDAVRATAARRCRYGCSLREQPDQPRGMQRVVIRVLVENPGLGGLTLGRARGPPLVRGKPGRDDTKSGP